jgi:hypothetical protein
MRETLAIRVFLRARKLWYSESLCEDARPSAPTMSYGSRAIAGDNLKRGILFREKP